jgi:hypothetical protein
LLVLHAVRIKGMADDHRIAARYGLEESVTSELLADFEAYGWISWYAFGETSGWSLTAAGKARNEQFLSHELDAVGARTVVNAIYADFLPSNDQLQRASTNWQLRPSPHDSLAPNKHDDDDWDAAVIASLTKLQGALGDLEARLVDVLSRFAGYQARFGAAITRTRAGDLRWVTGVGIDSCHSVWMELHEDLLATLGMQRSIQLG